MLELVLDVSEKAQADDEDHHQQPMDTVYHKGSGQWSAISIICLKQLDSGTTSLPALLLSEHSPLYLFMKKCCLYSNASSSKQILSQH
jgi:hypothetical protein